MWAEYRCKMAKSDFIFRCFASGSSGNCYYLGTYESGILIDAGISARTIHLNLKEMGLDWSNVRAVLITHDHADHIRAVGTIGERLHIPIYATPLIHSGIDRNYGVVEKLRTSRRYFEKGVPFELNGMTVNSFGISHDSTECVSYVIDFKGERFMIATDVGCVNPQLEQYVATAQHLVIEANHDEQMLLNGPYPSFLKERILSDTGHMSNHTCGRVLAQNYHTGLKHVFLCHLSLENNDPKLAYDTVRSYLEGVGVNVDNDLMLMALPRLEPTATFTFYSDDSHDDNTNQISTDK